jgi:hypothetical protein
MIDYLWIIGPLVARDRDCRSLFEEAIDAILTQLGRSLL